VNADNIRAEIARLERAAKAQTDSSIQRACEHRIADLKRQLEELKKKGRD
jgi:hypothetical protein